MNKQDKRIELGKILNSYQSIIDVNYDSRLDKLELLHLWTDLVELMEEE